MKKSLLIVLLALVMSTLVFVGCSGEEAGSGSEAQETDNNEEEETQNEEINAEANSDYPNENIEIIVPFAAGGGTDAVGRALAQSLKSELGVDVIVVNREGGSGAVGLNEGLQADPDGYTLTLVTREVTTLPLLGTAPFETLDFKYVSNVNIDPMVLVVPEDSKYETLDDLIEDLEANPGTLMFAASAVPNPYGILFAQETGTDFVTVPYQGAAPAITELLGGGADFGIYNPGEVKANVEGGTLRILGVMAEERFEGYPDAPTFNELGYDVVTGTYRGIGVPPETPDEITDLLEDAIAKAVEAPEFIEFMNSSFIGIGYRNAEEFKQMVENDMEVSKPIIEIMQKQ